MNEDNNYEIALENVLAIGLLITVAHNNKDMQALFMLLEQFVDAYDEFNIIVDEMDDEDEDDGWDQGPMISLDGKKTYKKG